jgi:probable addiction module antidote protein
MAVSFGSSVEVGKSDSVEFAGNRRLSSNYVGDITHLGNEHDMAAYLEAALEEGDPALVAAALGDIARAKGMTQVARDAGLGRESLYKTLSPGGNPEFATIMKVVAALGLQLHVAPVEALLDKGR